MTLTTIARLSVIQYLLVLWISVVSGSHGDDLYIFQDCRFQCEQEICYHTPSKVLKNLRLERDEYDDEAGYFVYHEDWQFLPMPLALHLQLLLWDCELNCDYECQRIVTRVRREEGEEVVQFHGKWPFWRVFGIQELASMVFSVGNMIANVFGFVKLTKSYEKADKLKLQIGILLTCSLITIVAWICSTIFHIREFGVTESMDYFLAGLTVLSGFFYIVVRYYRLYLPERRTRLVAFACICLAAYCCHIYRMIVDWGYVYNMQVNVGVGVLQYIYWSLLCFELYSIYYEKEKKEEEVGSLQNHLKYIVPGRLLVPKFYARSSKLYSLYPLLLSFVVILGMSLEIFDFPPIFHDLIDAHALWHFMTIIPTVFGWYDWMLWDINENIAADLQENDRKNI